MDTHLCNVKKLPLSGWLLKFCAIRTAMSLRIMRLLCQRRTRLISWLKSHSNYYSEFVVPSEGAWLFSAVCPRHQRARLALFWDTAHVRIITHDFTQRMHKDNQSQKSTRSLRALTSAATSATFPRCSFSLRISPLCFLLWILSWSYFSSLSLSRES